MLKQDFDWVLVVVHWSDELFPFPLPKDREIAHELASMGADGVVGHHPHVVRGMEVIGTCPVFYSLGNFYFAERQDNAGNWLSRQAPRNREGLGVKFTFQHNRKPEYELLSFWNNGQEAVLDKICRAMRRMRSTSIPLQIYQGTAYRNWYKIQRARFDKWDSRWHFEVMKRGVVDTLYRLIVRFYKTSYMSK